jgi:hypothetical protein
LLILLFYSDERSVNCRKKVKETKPAIACSVDRVGDMNRLIVADDEHETENVETVKAAR